MEVTSGAPEQHDARRWQLEQYGVAKNITEDLDFCFFFHLKTVDTMILNWEKPLGVRTLILLDKTQNS